MSNLDGVLANTTSAAFTVNLPASPSTGFQCIIADHSATFGTNNLTVGRNGSTINGTAADLVLDINGVSVQFVYNGTTWDVYAQIGGNGGTAVTLDGVQTLTNKTLTSPVISAITGLSTMTGGAGNMTITSGTGNSRTMALQTTTSGGVATTALTLNAAQGAAIAGTTEATTAGAGSLTTSGGIYAAKAIISGSTTASTSTTTGALVVSGGVGIAGAVNIGGNTAVTGTGSFTSSVSYGGTQGTTGSGQLSLNPGSPVSIRQTFGTDGTGWQYRIAKNQAGTITDYVTVTDSGNVGIGTTSPAAKLHVSGDIDATGNITAYYSDERLKTRLGIIEGALAKVKSLDGFYFEANETAQALGYEKKREVGVSAQQVEAILPEIIAPAPIDAKYKTLDYAKLVPVLIEAIKELSAKVDSLESELKRRM